MSATATAPAYTCLGKWHDTAAGKTFQVYDVDNHLVLEGDGEAFWLDTRNGELVDFLPGSYEDRIRDLLDDGSYPTEDDFLDGYKVATYLTPIGEAMLGRAYNINRNVVAMWLAADPAYDALAQIWAKGAK